MCSDQVLLSFALAESLVKDSQRTLLLGDEDAGGSYHGTTDPAGSFAGMAEVPATAPDAKALYRTMFF